MLTNSWLNVILQIRQPETELGPSVEHTKMSVKRIGNDTSLPLKVGPEILGSMKYVVVVGVI